MDWGRRIRTCPPTSCMHDTRPRGDDQIWSAGFLPKTYQALALDARRKEAIDNLARDAKHSDVQQRAQLDLIRATQSGARRRPPHAGRSRGPHQLVRARLPHADGRARGARHRQGNRRRRRSSTAWTSRECATFGRQCLIARRLVERGVRFVQIFAGKGVGGDGSVNDVPWDCHSDVADQSPLLRPAHRSARRRAAGRSERARAAGIDAGDLGRRVRPDLRFARREGPRPQPQRLHHLDGRRRRQGRLPLRRHRRVRLQGRARTRSTSTTCTPRCYSCSAWSTPN